MTLLLLFVLNPEDKRSAYVNNTKWRGKSFLFNSNKRMSSSLIISHFLDHEDQTSALVLLYVLL